jgi:hypothetical protein
MPLALHTTVYTTVSFISTIIYKHNVIYTSTLNVHLQGRVTHCGALPRAHKVLMPVLIPVLRAS